MAKDKVQLTSTSEPGSRSRNLSEGAAPYRSFFDSALSVVQTDLAGRILDCNPRLAATLLAGQEDIKARKFTSFVADPWRAKEEDARAEVLKNGVTEEYEIELIRGTERMTLKIIPAPSARRP